MAKKSRKVFATTATAALVASAVAPIASSAAGFSDVTKPEYKTAIDALAEAGILNGYENGTFKPENKVTRGEVAKVITLIRHLEEGTKTPFKDVKDGYWSTQYINSLYAAKLVNGYEDGTFKPEGNVTRAEFAKLVVDAYGLTLTNAATPFTDVKAGNWATPYIQTAYANGLIKGVTASKFDPSAPIKRGDLAILLHRADSKFGDVIGNNFPGVELVKATNNTTVEVTFKEAVEAKDVKAANFSIEGLTVSNAAVKQTDSKTVVLTTSAQEGGKQYTVKSGAATLGKFIGVSAVTPESISVVTNSLQGVVGKEVTVKAQVKVKDGESKAGIPVTFNINAGNKKFNKDYVQEVYTNADGVAEYSYTQYAGGEDLVTAYATGNANVRSASGKVYWGVKERLAISEVKEGNALTNGAKKVYKVKATTEAGGAASGYVNVAFAENVDVTPDKAVTTVEVTDGSEYGTTATKYPYQYTTGGKNYVRVKLDSAGEATFTVSGKDASVTPIVFFDGEYNTQNNWTGNNVLDATELQAKAATVKFEAIQAFGLTVESKGVKEASAITSYGQGGRDYKAVVTGKDGKLAPKGTKVYVVFKEENLKKNYVAGDVKVFDLNTEKRFDVAVPGANGLSNVITLETNDKGEVEFAVEGTINNFATPTVYLETGDKTGLDKNDLQKDGDIVYFGSAVVKNATLTVTDKDDNEVKTLTAPEKATFTYQSVDQNEKPYYEKDKDFYTTFEVTAGFNDVTVDGLGTVKAGKTESFKVNANKGKAAITLSSQDVSDVKVNASASQSTLPDLEASISFTKYSSADLATGLVSGVNTTAKTFTITDAKGKTYFYNYSGATYQILGGKVSPAEFEAQIKVAGTKVSVTKDADNKLVFNVIEKGTGVGTPSEGTIVSAVLSDEVADAANAVDTLTVTFSEAVKYDTIDQADFTFTGGGTATLVSPTVDTNKVVFKVTGTISDVAVSTADTITFVSGKSNKAISAVATTTPATASKLFTSKANIKAVAGADATASTTVDGETATFTVAAANNPEIYNGLTIKFVPGSTLGAAYNNDNKTITITLDANKAANTTTAIQGVIDGLADFGNYDFSNIVLSTSTNFDGNVNAATSVGTAAVLAGGKDTVSAQAGQYVFTLYNNLTVGTKVTVNGKTYEAGNQFTVGSDETVTAANLVAAIKANDARFAATSAATGATITLDDANADGANAPTITFN